MGKKLIRVDEVAKELEISESHAYKIMRKLNRELEAKGYIKVFQKGKEMGDLCYKWSLNR